MAVTYTPQTTRITTSEFGDISWSAYIDVTVVRTNISTVHVTLSAHCTADDACRLYLISGTAKKNIYLAAGASGTMSYAYDVSVGVDNGSVTGGAMISRDSTFTSNNDFTLTYENAKVQVIYNANGGTGAPATQTFNVGYTNALSGGTTTKSSTSSTYTVTYNKVESGSTISKSSDTVNVTRNYTFSRWNTKADGTGTNYYPAQSFKAPTTDTTLYAIYNHSDTGSVTLPTGTLTQYVLSGWSASQQDISYVANPYTPTSNVTLYAIWSPESNGGYLKFPSATGLTGVTAGSKLYLEGFHNKENDGPKTVHSYNYSNGYVELVFEEDFVYAGSQDGSTEALTIYGEGIRVPDMDYICALNNRLWGCSSKLRTIYASTLGDPSDFWTFAGDTMDAYQVAVGSAGNFTGCCAMNNNVLFFKQHVIHKMLGSFPAEYALYSYDYDGTSETNGLSAVNCDGTVIYVTEHGIGTYQGSSAGVLSMDLGEGDMYNAMSMFNGEQYFLFFKDGDQEGHTYIYDTRYRMWVEQDYGEVMAFAHFIDNDYVLKREGNNTAIYQIDTGLQLQGDWEIVFKPFYEVMSGNWDSKSHIFEKKRYTGLTFRVELPIASWIKAELKTDDGRWRPVVRMAGRKDKVTDFTVNTDRCDMAQLRLTGHGPMTILGMERQYTVGSRR